MELLGIPGATIVQGGLGGLGLFLLLLIALGRLIPLRTHEREMQDGRSRGDEYKAAWEATDARNDALAAQVGELLELAKTSNALIQALQTAAYRTHRDEP